MNFLFDRTIGQIIGAVSVLLGVVQLIGSLTDDPIPVGKAIMALVVLAFGVFVFKKARANQN